MADVLWLILPEGNGKTTLLAALGLFGLRYAGQPEMFTLEQFEVFCGKLVLDNGDPVVLEGFQRDFVRDVFEDFQNSPDGASIPIAASTRDQVRIMYRQMKGFVTRSGLGEPDKDGLWFECFDGYRQIQLRKPGKTRRGEIIGQIEVHAAEAGTADGVIPYPFAFLDELHRHKNMALHRTWRGKLNKRGAKLIVISTAGEPGHEFEDARAKIKNGAQVLNGGPFARYENGKVVMHEWMVRDEQDILDALKVKAANPLSAITPDTLAEKLADPTMTEAHWRRLTCNIATMDEGKEPFIDLRDWDELASEAMIPPSATICLGADGSRTWDTTVVAWASRSDDETVTVDARVFSVRKDIEAHVVHDGGKIDFDDVEAFVIDRFDEYQVLEAAYDPRYLERSMDLVSVRLPEALVYPVEPSSKNMRDALQAMFNLAAEGKLRHRGDEVIRQHVANCGAERGFSSELRRVRKLDPRLPIDAVPAMALAIWRSSLAVTTEGSFAFV